jgi:hypothetical protein
MQAAMETLVWPDGVGRPEFYTAKEGKTMGEKWNRKRGATSFELWASLTIVQFSSTTAENS